MGDPGTDRWLAIVSALAFVLCFILAVGQYTRRNAFERVRSIGGLVSLLLMTVGLATDLRVLAYVGLGAIGVFWFIHCFSRDGARGGSNTDN